MTYLVARGTEPVVIKEMPSLEAALEYAAAGELESVPFDLYFTGA